MKAFRSSSSTPPSLARTGLFLLSILLLSLNAIVWAFVPTSSDSLQLHRPVKRTHHLVESTQTVTAIRRPHQSRLYSSHAATQYTEFEVLDMKRRVLSISAESNDDRRRSYVSKWITGQATNINYEEGVRLIQLWDATVVQLGEELQTTLRSKARKKSRPCASIGSASMISQPVDDKLVLWAFVDMMVQSKTLINRLGIPKSLEGRRIFDYQRIQYKLDRNIAAPENDKRAFQ